MSIMIWKKNILRTKNSPFLRCLQNLIAFKSVSNKALVIKLSIIVSTHLSFEGL